MNATRAGAGQFFLRLLASLCFCVFFLAPNFGNAQETEVVKKGPEPGMRLAPPKTALLSPNGGRLEFVESVDVKEINGKKTVRFAIPANAADLQVTVPGRTIARMDTEPVKLDIGTSLSANREKLLARKADISAKLMAVKGRMALLQGLPKNVSPQDMSQMQQLIAQTMPELAVQSATLEENLRLVEQELVQVPQINEIGLLVSVVLDKDAGGQAQVAYSYMLPNCGWQAVYEFNARPGEGSGDDIDVRLLAKVWQYSGTDWTDTTITLATRGAGPREPAPLAEWVVDSSPAPRPHAQPAKLNAMKARSMATSLAAEAGDALPENAPVQADTQSVYATWTLLTRDLPEGSSRLLITSDAWKAPLSWLARPTLNDGRVFLMARYDLPEGKAWPDGLAEFCVDGQGIGNGEFHPHGGEAVIYLGADPRVNVRTTIDNRKQGEKGFINTSKTWTWAWTYTVTNAHDKEIKVKLERPMPQIVDQGVTVAYNDKPESQKDEKKHMLYWIVNVPPHGSASVEHSVTITSPTKLPLLPDVP